MNAEQQALEYDVVVVGAGAVGENVADRAGRGGLSVVIVEDELVGGECSYWACMPSKALLRPGAVLAGARAVPGASEAVTGGIDTAATLARRDRFTSDWDDAGQVRWLEKTGIDLVRGRARFTGPRELSLEPDDATLDAAPAGTVLRARRAVVVATGSVPVIPPVPGLAECEPWTSREATSAETVPASLVVIGGGVVACEMAVAYTDLGAAVTMLVRGDRLLDRMEPFAAQEVEESLMELGVDIRFGVEAVRAARQDGRTTVELSQGGSIVADQVLVATGRRPGTGDLGVEALGLEPGRPLAVDDAMQVTGVEGGWLFAAGDVTGRTGTTHQGKYDARVAGDVVAARFSDGPAAAEGAAAEERAAAPWSRYRATADHAAVPQVAFTRPEVSAVGLTEQEARAAGMAVRAVRYDLGNVAGASVAADGYRGTAQLVVDDARGVVVGATFTGPDAAELLHAATIAIVSEAPLDRLWHAVPAYPTVSEVWLRLLETAGL
ncbi:dihydrolipoyl dehydrogenase family protein [Cellulomonas chengniuliangii]|uniref:dihydrolipoyl dehydrogenase family protein n=1 Tax=Cellulomonas chengniuliangii TaxID=2968084 RepID=UPI001D0ECA39|nr:NAD(P)/FAD-dependent oxidoreductase [Cellulomonas chengniuliangii]MCC2319492.1 NAD(P)/FAD-dependent oxidoreductase [Cellulomonas chengniuliangii]